MSGFRGAPRWSVGGASGGPALIAGEPDSRACVWVGPPLSASTPSWGLWPMMSVGWLVIVHPEVFPIRLWPCEVTGVAVTVLHSGPIPVVVLPARIVPLRFTVPSA